MPTFTDRLQHAWNAFRNNKDPTSYFEYGVGSSYRPDRNRLRLTTERSIVASLINRIATDVASCDIRHVRLDDNGRYKYEIDSGLNYIFTQRANIDQTGRAFVQDIAASMCDEGVVAVVPVDTDVDPQHSGGYKIESMRTGKITQWYPRHVEVELYNDRTGLRERITLPKEQVAIIPNPFYDVMNEPNSNLKRLIRKLNLLDAIDEQSGSGKLDLIIQLPYVIKSPAKRAEAEKRRKDIEMQLSGSKYGIAYTDGTEHITQLNRSVDNNLMKQIEYLTSTLYSQLGITENVFNGTADEAEMLNYYNRTIEPILSAIVNECTTKFLTKTARTQHQALKFFKDPFKLVPVSQIAEIADKFTRNEIASSNEMRAVIGWKPVDDPRADQLRNKNLNEQADAAPPPTTRDSGDEEADTTKENQNGS